jgi:DNA polymerase-3 subunit delta
MKLAYAQLEQHLAKNLSAIYLICSDELLLAQEAVDSIRKVARTAGYSERVSLHAEQGTDWAKLLFEESHTLSLFATQRIVEINISGAKTSAATTKVLKELTETPIPHTLLIIRTTKLDSRSEQAAWFKTLEKNGVVIQIWAVGLDQLPNWIMQRAKKSALTLTPDAAKLIADQVEGNLLAAAQEIEKLVLLQSGTQDAPITLDAAAIAKIISDNARFDIFSLVECALAGNGSRSLRILDNLQAEGVEPVLVLWALAREVRTLAELARQTRQGVQLGVLFSQFRIWEKRQPGVRRFLQQNTQRGCWKLLLESAKIDRIIKGAAMGKVWNELKQLALKIAGNDIIKT